MTILHTPTETSVSLTRSLVTKVRRKKKQINWDMKTGRNRYVCVSIPCPIIPKIAQPSNSNTVIIAITTAQVFKIKWRENFVNRFVYC